MIGDIREHLRRTIVILTGLVFVAAVGCATGGTAEGGADSEPERAGAPDDERASGAEPGDADLQQGEELREAFRDAQYVQRERRLERLSADVLVRVGPTQPRAADGVETHRLAFRWEDPDVLEIRPAEGTSDPKAADGWAEQLRGLANLVVKLEMPASHRAETNRREADQIVAERDSALRPPSLPRAATRVEPLRRNLASSSASGHQVERWALPATSGYLTGPRPVPQASSVTSRWKEIQ